VTTSDLFSVDETTKHKETPMLKAPPSPTVFRPIDAATKLAAELQANDPDWTYTVEPRGEGRAVILCHDEDGHLIHCGM
jgi:hypothetical protein